MNLDMLFLCKCNSLSKTKILKNPFGVIAEQLGRL